MGLRDHERTVMTRLERTTSDRLKKLRERMAWYAEHFPEKADGRLLEDAVSLSTVIEILIDRWEAHRQRSYKSRRRQLPTTNATMPPPATETGG